MVKFGTDDQRARMLAALIAGDEKACRIAFGGCGDAKEYQLVRLARQALLFEPCL